MKEFDFTVDRKEMLKLKKEARNLVELLKKGVKRNKIKAEIFVGGSFAKGTLAESEEYDVDIFVRFDKKYEELSKNLGKILKSVEGFKIEKLHGSRDYYRVYKERKLTFEIIPVIKVKKVREAENVTDLSYFHVKYLKKNLNEKLRKEILLAKKFFKGIGVYGAESYIGGFSGYGAECLIINYRTFSKMLRELVKVKERVVLDPAKQYKRKGDIMIELNESKVHSPIVLVDPTWKERNVLAALTRETFEKFQTEARKYLKNPSRKFFDVEKFDVERFRKKKGEYVKVVLESDRQEGDIAGTKMKKFSKFLVKNLGRYFEVSGYEFVYEGEKNADVYLIGKAKKEVVGCGPPVKMKKEVKKFKKKNKKVFVKNGRLWSRERVQFSMGEFIRKFDREVMREMGVTKLKIG